MSIRKLFGVMLLAIGFASLNLSAMAQTAVDGRSAALRRLSPTLEYVR